MESYTLDALRDWFAKYANAGPADNAAANALIPHLVSSAFLYEASVSDATDGRGHVLIDFRPHAPKSRRLHRKVKTIYAAITLAIELAGGRVWYEFNPLPKRADGRPLPMDDGGEKFRIRAAFHSRWFRCYLAKA